MNVSDRLLSPLSLASVLSLVQGLAVCGQQWSWASWELEWCCWRRGTPSPGTMCSTYGPSPSTTCVALEPKSSMEGFVPAPSTTSVSQHSASVWSEQPNHLVSTSRFLSAGIRQLQLVLLKVALLLGVEVHVNVEFKKLVEPAEDQHRHSTA